MDIHCSANGEKNGSSFRESFRRRNENSIFLSVDIYLRVSVYIHRASRLGIYPPLFILALYWAVTQTYRDLLIGSKFVYTDNNLLSYLQTTVRLGADDIRWAAYLAQFNFSIKQWRIQILS